MLSCQSCKAALAIDFPPGLPLQAIENICKVYRQKLAVAHHKHCVFRLEAEQYFLTTDHLKACTERTKIARSIPLAFVNIFPRDFVDSIEHRSPSLFLAKRVQYLINSCCSQEDYPASIPFEYPKFNIAEELQHFKSRQEDGTFCDITKFLLGCSGLLGTSDISILLLAILGWKPIDANFDKDNEFEFHCVSLGCPLCLATMEITLTHKDSEPRDRGDLPAKRQRKLSRYSNPYNAHRHYCPIRCGFPCTISDADTPLWQVLMEKLETESQAKNDQLTRNDLMMENTVDPEDAVRTIRDILSSGIAEKKLIS